MSPNTLDPRKLISERKDLDGENYESYLQGTNILHGRMEKFENTFHVYFNFYKGVQHGHNVSVKDRRWVVQENHLFGILHGECTDNRRSEPRQYYYKGQQVDENTWLELSKKERTGFGETTPWNDIEYTNFGKTLSSLASMIKCEIVQDERGRVYSQQYTCKTIRDHRIAIPHGRAIDFNDAGGIQSESYYFYGEKLKDEAEFEALQILERIPAFYQQTFAKITYGKYSGVPEKEGYICKQYESIDQNAEYLISEEYDADLNIVVQNRRMEKEGRACLLTYKFNTDGLITSEEFQVRDENEVWQPSVYALFANNKDPLQEELEMAMPFVNDAQRVYIGLKQ